MEFGLREWMILIGGLLILAVIADGVRRLLAERRDVLRMSVSQKPDTRDGEDFNPELPNGGARALDRDDFDNVRSRPRYPESESPAPVARTVPRARPVPEPVEPEKTPAKPGPAPAVEPAAQLPAEPEAEPEPVVASAPLVQEPLAPPEPPVEPSVPPEPPKPRETLNAKPDEVLIINVLSRDNNGFNGADLLEVLLACDVRFGDMNIFHRYEGAQGQGRIQFSVANLVKPGTFNLDTIREFYTPGVSMFLQLPGPEDSMAAFDCMAETASCIVKNLQGEMRDEDHSVLTAQTLEHYRERIRDHERKRLMQAAHRSA